MMGTALQRVVGRAAARRGESVQRCGLCAAVLAEAHRHVLDGADDDVLCACPACTLLFGQETAGRYLLIPRGRTRLAGVRAEVLNVPVGLAFFVKQADGAVVAHYPSPLGSTRSAIDPSRWRAVEQDCPALASMKPRVEAYLVRTSAPGGRDEHWVLPVDDCFRLVAVIRRHWTGLAGGAVVWREVARFFAELDNERRQEERWQTSG